MNNTKYNLLDFFETLKNDAEFNTIMKRVNENILLNITTINGIKLKVYSAQMFYLLKSNDYINEGFIESYLLGFENGIKFIKQKTKKDMKGLYSSCPEKYIDELKRFYFNEAPNELTGYKCIATSYPINFYIEQIEKIGFASGVINAIDLMAIENPLLFEKFYEATPQQPENVKPDEVIKDLHNRIFVGNYFEVWQSMFDKFKINKSKRTDIDFMFEVMKYNNQIHKNIGYTDIEDWINEVHEITFDKIKYTNHKATSNEKRLIIYNEIIQKQL